MSNFYFLILICAALHFIHYDVNCNIILGSFKTCYVVKQSEPKKQLRLTCKLFKNDYETINWLELNKLDNLDKLNLKWMNVEHYKKMAWKSIFKIINNRYLKLYVRWYQEAIQCLLGLWCIFHGNWCRHRSFHLSFCV